MARTITPVTADDLGSSGSLLQEPGFYHLLIEDIRDGKICGDQEKLIEGGGLGVRFKAIHGPHADHHLNCIFYDPQSSHKDGGKFARKKQTALLVAANVLPIESLTSEAPVSYDENLARSQQVIAEFELGKPNDQGKRYLDISFANIYHVDDPRVKAIEKSEAHLELIPKQFRRPEEYFAAVVKKTPANAPATATGSRLDDSITDGL